MPSAIHSQIWELEKRKQIFLSIEEASWRLKIQDLWLKEDDKNLKIFHRFDNKWWEANSI